MLRIFISGRPGVGKTTVFMKVVKALVSNGVKVRGFTCPEIRVERGRLGFDLVDIVTGRRAKLARLLSMVSSLCSIRLGRYCVFQEAGDLGAEILESALREGVDVIAIDEIGPMELKIPKLRSMIYKVLLSEVNVLAVVHRGIAEEIASKYRGRLIWITSHNRGVIHNEIIKEFIKNINMSKNS